MTAIAAVIVLFFYWSPVYLAVVKSDSIPMGLYLADSRVPDKLLRGQIVCFPYESPAWAKKQYLYPGELLCKHVEGIPGDTLHSVNNRVFDCHEGHCESLGDYLQVDSGGRSVGRVSWGGEPIPKGEYFLGSTRRKNSLDSRYLGLVPVSKIVKTLVPLLVQTSE